MSERRFLLSQTGGAFVANIPINGLFAWFSFREPTAPLFAKGPCVAFDTVGTSFFLPLITCLVLTPVVRRLLRQGKAPALRWTPRLHRAFGWLPRSTLGRGAALGGLSILLFAPPVLGAMAGVGITEMSRAAIIAFKGGYGAVLAALITTPLVFCAIAASPDSPSPEAEHAE